MHKFLEICTYSISIYQYLKIMMIYYLLFASILFSHGLTFVMF